jgi:hypothetical protein
MQGSNPDAEDLQIFRNYCNGFKKRYFDNVNL